MAVLASGFDTSTIPTPTAATTPTAASNNVTDASSLSRFKDFSNLVNLTFFKYPQQSEPTSWNTVFEDTSSVLPKYLFSHSLLRDVAYSRLIYSYRAFLHRAYATWFEQTYEDDKGAYMTIICHHWSKVAEGETDMNAKQFAAEKAIYYMLECAREARDKCKQQRILFNTLCFVVHSNFILVMHMRILISHVTQYLCQTS